jgi:hypothetical protein
MAKMALQAAQFDAEGVVWYGDIAWHWGGQYGSKGLMWHRALH